MCGSSTSGKLCMPSETLYWKLKTNKWAARCYSNKCKPTCVSSVYLYCSAHFSDSSSMLPVVCFSHRMWKENKFEETSVGFFSGLLIFILSRISEEKKIIFFFSQGKYSGLHFIGGICGRERKKHLQKREISLVITILVGNQTFVGIENRRNNGLLWSSISGPLEALLWLQSRRRSKSTVCISRGHTDPCSIYRDGNLW